MAFKILIVKNRVPSSSFLFGDCMTIKIHDSRAIFKMQANFNTNCYSERVEVSWKQSKWRKSVAGMILVSLELCFDVPINIVRKHVVSLMCPITKDAYLIINFSTADANKLHNKIKICTGVDIVSVFFF